MVPSIAHVFAVIAPIFAPIEAIFATITHLLATVPHILAPVAHVFNTIADLPPSRLALRRGGNGDYEYRGADGKEQFG